MQHLCNQSNNNALWRQELFDKLPDAMIGIDLQGRILYWNIQATCHFGWQKAEVIEQNITDFLSFSSTNFTDSYSHLAIIENFTQTSPPLQIFVRSQKRGLHEFSCGKLTHIPPLEPQNPVHYFLIRSATEAPGQKKLSDFDSAASDSQIASPELLRLVTKSLPAFTAYIDKNERCLFANNAYALWFSKHLDEIQGHYLKDFLTAEEYAGAQICISELPNGKIKTFRKETITPSNEKKVFQGTHVPDLDAQGNYRGFVMLGYDITELCRYQNALSESEIRFRSLFEQSPVALQLFSPDGFCTYANLAWEKLWNTSREDLDGYNILSDPQLEGTENGELIRRAFAGEVVHLAAFQFVPQKSGRFGRPRWIEVDLYPVQENGGPIREIAVHLEDVTLRTEAMEALKDSELRFRTVFDEAGVGMALLDLDGKWLRTNDAFLMLFGMIDLQLQDDFYLNLIHADDRLQAETEFKLLQHGTSVSLNSEMKLLRQNNSSFHGIFNISCAKDEKGCAKYYILMVQDITKRKEAELSLQDARNHLEAMVHTHKQDLKFQKVFLEALLESLNEAIVACDSNGILTLFNRTAREFHGLELKTLPQSKWVEHYDLFKADGKTRLTPETVPLARALAGEEVHNEEVVIAASGCPQRIVLTSGRAIFDEHHNKLGAVVAMHDITDIKTAESDRMSHIREKARREEAESATKRMEFLSQATKILLADRAEMEGRLEALARITVDFLGTSCKIQVLVSENTLLSLTCTGGNSIALESEEFTFEDFKNKHRLHAHSDRLLEHELPWKSQFNLAGETRLPIQARGKFLGFLILFGDATAHYTQEEKLIAEELANRIGLAVDNALLYNEARQEIERRKLIEIALMKTQCDLENAVLARDEFLSIASHELKTPLTVLKLNSQYGLLRFSRNDASFMEPRTLETFLKSTGKQVEKLIELVDDMFDVSRIAHGQLVLNIREGDLCALMNETVHRFQEQYPAAGIQFEFNSSACFWGAFDLMRIEQVVTNLLSNAIKYGQGNPIGVMLCRENNNAVFKVKDSGIGIAPENLQRIFRRFERAVPSHDISGLGLGLYISLKIIEAHAGMITAESRPGCHTVFTVTLPMNQNREQDSHDQSVLEQPITH